MVTSKIEKYHHRFESGKDSVGPVNLQHLWTLGSNCYTSKETKPQKHRNFDVIASSNDSYEFYYLKVEQKYRSVQLRANLLNHRDTKKLFDTQPLLTASVLPFRILQEVMPGDGKHENKSVENLGQRPLPLGKSDWKKPKKNSNRVHSLCTYCWAKSGEAVDMVSLLVRMAI